MKEKKKEFEDMPKLLQCFESLDRRIRYFHPTKGSSLTKEELVKEKENLLQTARELDVFDLRIIFYVKKSSGVFRSTLLKSLEDLYRAERAYKAVINKPSE